MGTGVIGTGWAVRALAAGHDVVATDQAPGAEERLRRGIERAWPAVRKLGLYPGADPSRVTWAASLAEVGTGVDLIQESVPEDLAIKAAVHAELDAAAPPTVIIASSSSGLLPTVMQAELGHPDRFVVGHPFNPVYLLPLVEVIAGSATSPDTVEAVSACYRGLGMHPLVVRHEIEGYLSDRLQEAMWREILHLVNDGVATTDELDQAIIYGPGLRWAGMGTNLTFYLAGGAGGMRHMLSQFGPALQLPWTHLVAPELTEDLIEAMAAGTEEQADGRSVEQLERLRDAYLVAVMRALRAVDVGAGRTLAQREAAIHGSAAAVWQDGKPIPAPLRLYRAPVEPEWVDYNGHMTESAFLLAAGWASDALFRYVGDDEAYRASGNSFYTAETHILFLKEATLDQMIGFDTYVLGVDDKRLHFVHVLVDAATGERLCTVEQMLVHVDTHAGRSSPIQPGVRKALDAVAATHRGADPGIEPKLRIT